VEIWREIDVAIAEPMDEDMPQQVSYVMQQNLQMISDNRVMLVQNHNTIVQADTGLAKAMALVANVYRDEMQAAKAEAERQHQIALSNQLHAERYAQTTIMVGTQAMHEIQERDKRVHLLEEHITQCETVAQKWEHSAYGAYKEARDTLSHANQYVLQSETQMASLNNDTSCIHADGSGPA
jgi:hypothetical protein